MKLGSRRLHSSHRWAVESGRIGPKVLKSTLGIVADKTTLTQVFGEEEETFASLDEVGLIGLLKANLGVSDGKVVLDVASPATSGGLDVLVLAQTSPADTKVHGEVINNGVGRCLGRSLSACDVSIGLGGLTRRNCGVCEVEPLRLVASQGWSILGELLLGYSGLDELASMGLSGLLFDPSARLGGGINDIASLLLDEDHARAIFPLVFRLFDFGVWNGLLRLVEIDCCFVSGAFAAGERRGTLQDWALCGA